MANPFDIQNRYGGYAFSGYGSNPTLVASRIAALNAQREQASMLEKQRQQEAMQKQKEFEASEMEKARTPAKYRNSRGTPFDKYTIAKIEAGVYRNPNEPTVRPRQFQGINKWDDPEEWAKRTSGAAQSAEAYSNAGRATTEAMRQREKEREMRQLMAGAGNQENPSATYTREQLRQMGQKVYPTLAETRARIQEERALAGTEDGVPITAGSRYSMGGGDGIQSSKPKSFGMDPMMQLASVGQQFGQIRQMMNPNLRTQQSEQIPTFPSSNIQAPQPYQETSPSVAPISATNFQPTNFRPQMDALRFGIMGRMAQGMGINLPRLGQSFKQEPTPYWMQMGMNPPKFPA